MSFKHVDVAKYLVDTGILEVRGGEVWRVKVKQGGRAGNINACEPRRAENKLDSGYLQIQIYQNGVRYTCLAHDLIWHLYNGNAPHGSLIHHKNRIRHDNRIENLECVTFGAHNAHHAKERDVWQKGKTKKDPEFKLWHEKTIRTKAENYKQKAIKTYQLVRHNNVSIHALSDSMGCTTRTIYQHMIDCKRRGWLSSADVHNSF